MQPEDTALANRLAVGGSGVWNLEGEYKGTRGEFYKLSGYFAYVASTPWSNDRGEAAVLAAYLEPLAGGAATWTSARLACHYGGAGPTLETRCLAVEGASQLLDLNFVVKFLPVRGERVQGVIRQPDDKSPERRFEGRSSERGKFTLVPPEE